MLNWLARRARHRAATALVVLYALCVLAPAAALAFGDGTKAAHCLTDESHGRGVLHADGKSHAHGKSHEHSKAHAGGKTHVHQDGTAHQHAGEGDEQQGAAGQCCGLFCLSALAPSIDLSLAQHVLPTLAPALNANGLLDHGPYRLDRPPDSLPSL